MAAVSDGESIVASTCPVVTVSPAATSTAVTVPGDVKLSACVSAAATVPSAVTVWSTVPWVTWTRRRVLVGAADAGESGERMANHQTAAPATATATPTATTCLPRGREAVPAPAGVAGGPDRVPLPPPRRAGAGCEVDAM